MRCPRCRKSKNDSSVPVAGGDFCTCHIQSGTAATSAGGFGINGAIQQEYAVINPTSGGGLKAVRGVRAQERRHAIIPQNSEKVMAQMDSHIPLAPFTPPPFHLLTAGNLEMVGWDPRYAIKKLVGTEDVMTEVASGDALYHHFNEFQNLEDLGFGIHNRALTMEAFINTLAASEERVRSIFSGSSTGLSWAGPSEERLREYQDFSKLRGHPINDRPSRHKLHQLHKLHEKFYVDWRKLSTNTGFGNCDVQAYANVVDAYDHLIMIGFKPSQFRLALVVYENTHYEMEAVLFPDTSGNIVRYLNSWDGYGLRNMRSAPAVASVYKGNNSFKVYRKRNGLWVLDPRS